MEAGNFLALKYRRIAESMNPIMDRNNSIILLILRIGLYIFQ